MFSNYRSSRPEVFCKKGFLRNFVKFTGKHLCQNLFFSEAAGLITFLYSLKTSENLTLRFSDVCRGQRKVARPVTLLKRDFDTGVFL